MLTCAGEISRKRQRVAEYLIEHASTLPFGFATGRDGNEKISDVLTHVNTLSSTTEASPRVADEPSSTSLSPVVALEEPTIPASVDAECLPSPLQAPTIKRVPLEQQRLTLPTPIVRSDSPNNGSSEKFLVALARPPSMVLAQRLRENEALLAHSASFRLEDVESNPSSPTAYHAGTGALDEPKDTVAALLSLPLSDDEDIVAVAARVERKSSRASASATPDSSSEIHNRPKSWEYDQEERTSAAITAARGEPVCQPSDSTAPDSSMTAQSAEDANDTVPQQQQRDKPQLRIAVRSNGTADSTTMHVGITPQTLRSVEDLKQLPRDPLAAVESPRMSRPSKKLSFISDLRHILKRKKTPQSSSTLATDAAVIVTPALDQGPRSLSLPTVALASTHDASLHLPEHQPYNYQQQEPDPLQSLRVTPRTIVLQNARTQTTELSCVPTTSTAADKATETLVQPPADRLWIPLFLDLENRLKNVQRVRYLTVLVESTKDSSSCRCFATLHRLSRRQTQHCRRRRRSSRQSPIVRSVRCTPSS